MITVFLITDPHGNVTEVPNWLDAMDRMRREIVRSDQGTGSPTEAFALVERLFDESNNLRDDGFTESAIVDVKIRRVPANLYRAQIMVDGEPEITEPLAATSAETARARLMACVNVDAVPALEQVA